MKAVIEVTLRIEVNNIKTPLDENSVKALVNTGTSAISRKRRILSTIGDQPIESVNISVVKLKENGKCQALSLYGTDSVPWNNR